MIFTCELFSAYGQNTIPSNNVENLTFKIIATTPSAQCNEQNNHWPVWQSPSPITKPGLQAIHTFSLHSPMPSRQDAQFAYLLQSLFMWHSSPQLENHDDVIKWKQFPRYWPFVRGIHRSPVNSPHKGQWRRALMFSLICARINGWVNNREAGDLRRHPTHCDVIVMWSVRVQSRSNMQPFSQKNIWVLLWCIWGWL